MNLIDAQTTLGEDVDGLHVKATQFIPGTFMDRIADLRGNSVSTPAGEFHLACSIPEITVDRWHREGFDINRESIQDIMKKLRAEHLDGFIATNKRI
jgi:hypothetical protein